MRNLDIKLPLCCAPLCEEHPVKEWPVLEEISARLDTNLKEVVIRMSVCDVTSAFSVIDIDTWIWNFVMKMWKEGKNVCFSKAKRWVETPYNPFFDVFVTAAEDTSLAFIRKIARGRDPIFNIHGDPGAAFNFDVFEMLSSLSEDGFFCLNTNTKIMKLDSLEHLNSCKVLHLFTNGSPIEDKEVNCVDSIIAHVAREPRPRFPERIVLPKVLNFS